MLTAGFETRVKVERRPLLLELLEEFAVPELAGGCEITFLPGGACNENYRITASGGERFVLRLAELEVDRFGFDRVRGADAHRSAAEAGVAPELVGIHLPEGHSLARWVDGPILDAERIRAPGMLEAVGETLRTLHLGRPVSGSWSVFSDCRKYVGIARQEGLPLPSDIAELEALMETIEGAFDGLAVVECPCHNDLQLQNFIVGDDRVWLIDFEFAGMGNPYFDLGNCAVNGELDDDELEPLVRGYFGRFDAAERARIQLMMVMAAYREALWAVVAEPVLELDWDYQAWAAEYFRRTRAAAEGDAFAARLELAKGGHA